MKEIPKITFFMLVTNRDILIADYAIKSYRLLEKYPKKNPFVLFIYANCISEPNKNKYFPKWLKYNFVKIYDNSEKVKNMNLVSGATIISPEGIPVKWEGSYEHCDELWTTELKKIETEYFATVDADFEIIKAEFIDDMINKLELNRQMAGISSDSSPTVYNIYDSYSKRTINLYRRWHTWFCIYKKEAHCCNTSHYYYEEVDQAGQTVCFDSAANFQHHLISDHGFKFGTVGQYFQHQFIHYGAFSKNRTITSKNIWFYRLLTIYRKNGISVLSSNNKLLKRLNSFIMNTSSSLLQKYFNENERETYNYDNE